MRSWVFMVLLGACGGLGPSETDTAPVEPPGPSELEVREAIMTQICTADQECGGTTIYATSRQCQACYGDAVATESDFDTTNAQTCIDEMQLISCPSFDAATLPDSCWDFLNETTSGIPEELFGVMLEIATRNNHYSCPDAALLSAPICHPLDCEYDPVQATRCLLGTFTCVGDAESGYNGKIPVDCNTVRVCQ